MLDFEWEHIVLHGVLQSKITSLDFDRARVLTKSNMAVSPAVSPRINVGKL
jgi:hypothetical protein